MKKWNLNNRTDAMINVSIAFLAFIMFLFFMGMFLW